MATMKQKAAARRNIKKAQAARWGARPRYYKLPKPKHVSKVRRPIHRVSTPRVGIPLDKIRTLI